MSTAGLFADPAFTFWNVVYTLIGALVCWGKWGRTELRAYVVSGLVDLLPVGKAQKRYIEFAIFMALGCVVAIGVAQPVNATQAIAAGFGWTSAFTTKRP